MKMRNFVRENLAKNGYVVGAFVASGSAMNCECLAINGYDFAIIDAEHAQTDCETLVEMSRASELYGMSAFVRVYDPCDYTMMSRLLDVGIHGIMVPMVESSGQAERIISAVKYPPLGHRGANLGRGPRWGKYENYPQQANDTLYTIVQCETREGVESIDAICRTEGIDCVFIGTGDLSQDLGHMGDPKHPEVEDAIVTVLAACQRNGVVPGIVAGGAEAAAQRLKQGFQLVTCMNDQVFFRQESEKRLLAVRSAFEKN